METIVKIMIMFRAPKIWRVGLRMNKPFSIGGSVRTQENAAEC